MNFCRPTVNPPARRAFFSVLLAWFCAGQILLAAADYKQVTITDGTNFIRVRLSLNEVLTPDGAPRKAGNAKSKEMFFYDFNRANAAFRLGIIHAFGLASQPHNEDIRKILGKILETATKP